MYLQNETKMIQEKLGWYCRTGHEENIPLSRPDRLHHYRRLIRNVFSNTLQQAYPITFAWIGPEDWDKMVDEFMQEHQARTNKIWQLAGEFLEFAEKQAWHIRFKRDYLLDLMRLEWVEIEIFTMPDQPIPPFREEGDWLNDQLVVNPEHTILLLEYPVHRYPVEELSGRKGQYVMLVFRHLKNGEVRFIELSSFFTLFVQNIQTGGTLSGAVESVTTILGIQEESEVFKNCIQLLTDLHREGFILGFEENEDER